ncbi:hypothetical protein GCM10010517_28420 [Streptosporangium fragile]|uniref:Uncharacterized protein n=1 Tax=Streptosporangium fragile TaxID=46186 RepID=A0ABP6IC96_9ACTN
MSEQPGHEEHRPVERGEGEKTGGASLTPAEERNLMRPAGSTPGSGSAPGSGGASGSASGSGGASGSASGSGGAAEVSDAEYMRLKELNPDDFE